MKEFVKQIVSLSGWKRYFAVFLSGFVLSLGLPPVNFFPIAIISLPLLYLFIEHSTCKKQAFYVGWWFGFGYFLSGLYWISFALLTDLDNFAWLIPFALFAIPAVLAIYIGLMSSLTYILPLKSYRKIVAFAIVWTLFEMLRGWLFTGFPWNLIGYIWSDYNPILQIVSVTGIYGLSFITALVFTFPAGWLSGEKLKPVIMCSCILPLLFVGGMYRMDQNPTVFQDNVKVRLVQPNIPQNSKWDYDERQANFDKVMTMSTSKGFEDITHVIWPESAMPFYVKEDSQILQAMKYAVPENGALIAGVVRAEVNSYDFIEKLFNSVYVIDKKERAMSYYDKSHLVPFGEYVPFRSVLPIDKITHGNSDFSSGAGLKTLNAAGLKISPLICYEIIFPGNVIDKNDRPDVIVNVTNDAWYGNTSGPYQHFNIAKVRAIEEGLALIRVANSGVSGVVDPVGRIIYLTELSRETILDSPVPASLTKETLYFRLKNLVVCIGLLTIAIFLRYL